MPSNTSVQFIDDFMISTTTADARTAIGVVIGTDVQPILSEGAFVDGDKTKLDSNTGDQTISLVGDITAPGGAGELTTTISAGAVDLAMLSATGTSNNTTFLRGDNTWASPPSGGGGTTLSGTTANDTQTEIYVDGTPTNRVDVATGSTITFSALVAARSATESAGYKIEGVIKNDAGTAEIVGVVVKTIFAEEDIAWDATVTAANNAITFLVTGDSVDSVSWEVTLNKIEAT